jgi:hypothetical protein
MVLLNRRGLFLQHGPEVGRTHHTLLLPLYIGIGLFKRLIKFFARKYIFSNVPRIVLL